MNDTKAKKLQYLLISHLLEVGRIELLLPDGMKLEIGITQENTRGDLVKSDNYCYVIASRDCKSTLIDSYNLGLRFEQGDDTIIYNDEVLDGNGRVMQRLDVV